MIELYNVEFKTYPAVKDQPTDFGLRPPRHTPLKLEVARASAI